MLTNDAIAQKIFKVIRDSEAIFDAANDLFGKPHAVYLGFSGTQAPPAERCPAFEIVSWGQERGETRNDLSFTFSILISVEDPLLNSEITTKGVYTEVYQGAQSAEMLLELALTAIKGISANLAFEDQSFIYDSIEYFPLFVGVLTLTITFPALIGGFEPSL